MNVGMLWFDNDPKTDLFTKVKRAANYYQVKYGQNPNICYVHPNMVSPANGSKSDDQSIKAGDIEVHQTNLVLPNHLWIGIGTSNGNLVS